MSESFGIFLQCTYQGCALREIASEPPREKLAKYIRRHSTHKGSSEETLLPNKPQSPKQDFSVSQ